MSASVELSPLFDATLERVGIPLDHPYIERVYCSVLGPSSVLFLRRVGGGGRHTFGNVSADVNGPTHVREWRRRNSWSTPQT